MQVQFTEAETEQAFQLARQQQLPVLVDFWAPGCKGCKKMELTTYQSAEILSYINSHFVFVKYDISNRDVPRLQCSPILWTPTFIVFANDGSEVRKVTGYLHQQQFVAEMEIGRAIACLRKAQAKTAIKILEDLIENSPLPEALYWAGVASFFLQQRNADALVPYWQRLLEEYPNDTWAERADCLHIKI